jgi:AraC-like DNA-binding protein
LAKIAGELQRALRHRAVHGIEGAATPRVLARGDGWSVADVVCTSGPDDRRFEEQHTHYSVAIVVAGTFQLHSPLSDGVLVPGALMLGNHGQCFECGHEHGHGDRCVSFYFTPEFFARTARDAGVVQPAFRTAQLPPAREFAAIVARASAGLVGRDMAWDEVAVHVLEKVVQHAMEGTRPARLPLNAAARVSAIVRAIDHEPEAPHALATLAQRARLSPFHFLRTFEALVGVTPHQYVRRTRLRHAAVRLASSTDTVISIALDCGFGDVSNFNRAFRTEFGVAPNTLRAGRIHLS